MARPPKPWFWKARNGWYVTIRGERHFLGTEKDAAQIKFYGVMAKPQHRVVISTESVAVLIDRFLEFVQQHRAPDTYEWYRFRLNLFHQKYPDLTVQELIPFHVQQWIDGYQLSNGSKRNYARAIQRCMKWCEDQRLIDRSPIRNFVKPRGGVRNTVISPEEYAGILDAIRRRPFKDLCTFAWETGARAAEILAVEKRHLDLKSHRVLFPVEEEKMQRAPRIIYLTEEAEGILRRLSLRTPKGRLFRNTDGAEWTTDAVNCAFVRLQKKLNKKYCLTVFRHSFIHRKLVSGVDALTLSVLVGHVDTTTIGKVYAHLTQAPEYLLKAVRA